MARRATVIRQERNKGQRILVLDAGASLLNDRDPAKKTLGKSSIEIMNLMGYDAMALGLLDISPLGLSALRQRMAEAEFPMLSANAYISGTKELVTKPYIVIEMADHHVGILGLTEAGSTDEVMAIDPIQAAREQIPELRRQADIIIVLSHAGPETDQQIADQVPGIAVIVSGRNQQGAEAVGLPSGAILLHADSASPGHAGENVGVAHLSFDKAGHLLKQDWRRVVLDGNWSDDPQIVEWMRRTPTP